MASRLDWTLTLAALLAWSPPVLAAAPTARTTKPPPPSEDVLDFDPEQDPPTGAPADLALWRSGRQVTFDVLSSRREASRLQRHIRSQRIKERLGEVASGKAPEEVGALRALQARIQAGWQENYGIMARRWPVDTTRGCGYPWLTFDSALRSAAAGQTRADVVTARKELQACVGKAGAAIQAMQRSNAELAATLAEAERMLPSREPAAAPAEVGATKAKSDDHEAHERHERDGEEREDRREHGARRD